MSLQVTLVAYFRRKLDELRRLELPKYGKICCC